MLQLILGGARSGKSCLAEQLAQQSQLDVIYLATATASDKEMAARIAMHQRQRPAHWLTIETPIELASSLQHYAQPNRCLLVDCLTLWLNNCLIDAKTDWQTQKRQLLRCLPQLPGNQILVSNEVGQGIIPVGELSRQFVDESGRLHQELAQVANRVIFVVAGLPQVLKGRAL